MYHLSTSQSTLDAWITLKCFTIAEIPIYLCRLPVHFQRKTDSITDARYLCRIVGNIYGQCLSCSFDDDIIFR